MNKPKLTSEGLAERLPQVVMTLRDLADESGVNYERLRNFYYGRIKDLNDEELRQLEKSLKARKLLIPARR